MRELFDSTSLFDIPVTAAMVAYYVDGIYAVPEAAVRARFPRAVLVPISCLGRDAGVVADVEVGCLSPAQFPGWAHRRRAAGVIPTAYVNRSNWQAVIDACHAAGEPLPLWWVSTLDRSQPWGPGVMAIQIEGSVLTGGHYDRSLALDHWPGVDSAAGAFTGAIEMLISVKDGPRAGQVFATNGVTARYISDPAVLGELTSLLGPPHAVSGKTIEWLLAGGGAQAFELTVTPK